jgi:hypothetical protein
MGIRIECDWCRQPIGKGESYITLAIDGKINREDVSGPARVFCGQKGSCGSRLLALLNGDRGGRIDMGMEWQLVPVSGPAEPQGKRHHSSTPPPKPVSADAELLDLMGTLAPSAAYKLEGSLRGAGISTLDQVAAMSDDDLMEVDGIGWALRTKLRRFIEERHAARATPTTPAPAPVGDHDLYEVIPRTDAQGGNFDDFRVRRGYRKFLPNNLCPGFLYDAGIRTVDDLRRAVEDGSILDVGSVGPKTAARIADVLARSFPQGVPA